MALLWPFDLCFMDLHFSFACLSFIFGIFSFVGDKCIASAIFNLSKDLRSLNDLRALRLDSRVVIEEWLS